MFDSNARPCRHKIISRSANVHCNQKRRDYTRGDPATVDLISPSGIRFVLINRGHERESYGAAMLRIHTDSPAAVAGCKSKIIQQVLSLTIVKYLSSRY